VTLTEIDYNPYARMHVDLSIQLATIQLIEKPVIKNHGQKWQKYAEMEPRSHGLGLE